MWRAYSKRGVISMQRVAWKRVAWKKRVEKASPFSTLRSGNVDASAVGGDVA